MPLKVLHFITHLALGGATETVLTCCRLSDPAVVSPAIFCGETSAQEESLEAEARRDGIPVHHLPGLRRTISPIADFRAYRRLVAWLRAGHWDVIHTNGSKAGVLGRLAAASAGIPVIIHTVHGWGHHERQNPLVRGLYVAAERRAARVTDRMIVVAEANREKGLADGIGRLGQYVKIHSCIDIPRYRDVRVDRAALRQALDIPAQAPVVGTVSRFAEQKAPADFIRMAVAIARQRPDAYFVFVGGGPLQAQTEALAREAGLQARFRFLGYREDVPELLRVFDVFALTSLWEGLPRVFAQAMCASLPIVATHVDGAAEAVREGVNGFLVPPGQPLLQAERVLRLLDNPDRRAAMGQRGRELVFPQFDEQDMVRRIEEIYLECARSKHLIPASDSAQIGTRIAAQEVSAL